ncbi:C2 calcium-dependent domain-containing protein 4C [Colossoma macropomum]|uniref:C2 calcium-dependent domain-containing protein 4C n=1 Tax=Colossoma macropomum TaxID=42526 RepID=UPI001865455B|nr:C2 calcium-dependent domain-containing protein 4C [Colossoma macropomum]
MWILRRVQESAESFPAEISRLVSKNSEEISAKANLLNKLHNNVLTPDKIPDFFLPPRLSRRSLVAAEGTVSQRLGEKQPDCGQNSRSKPDMTTVKTDMNKGTVVGLRGPTPVPFSLKSYESGLFESPNTRRKESLFHSAFTRYKLERVTPRAAPELPSITLLKASSMESDSSSSADSSPHSSPPPSWPVRRKWDIMASLSRSASKESLHKDVPLSFRNTEKAQTEKATPAKASHNGTAQHLNCLTLTPPLQCPLDMLHCQERLHSEHILLLPNRGCIRLSASHSDTTGDLSTVRIRVISVEGLREPGDLRPLHCGLTLSLTPGKLQRQHSATIRNCRNPVFNEDFFFTEPEGEEGGLREMALRVKVLDKASGLGRAAVLGVIVKPLSELLPARENHLQRERAGLPDPD